MPGDVRSVVEILFWTASGLLIWTLIGYGVALRLIVGARSHAQRWVGRTKRHLEVPTGDAALPSVSLIIAAHNEQEVIAVKVANACSLDYPRELLQVIVACDGCTDQTAAEASGAGADLVLALPWEGKVRAQDAAVDRSQAEIVAFSDANAFWEPGALKALVGAFSDPSVGYACGQVRFEQAGLGAKATNQEGVYWRYEMRLRELESALSSITAGNGAIYVTRRAAYLVVDPVMGHDLSLPFNMVKRGRRAVYVPQALAKEKMVPSIEGEFARKRRMMSHAWPIVMQGGMLSPRGYPLGYALMVFSHRVLRYFMPALHMVVLAANVAIVASATNLLYLLTLGFQCALVAMAVLGTRLRTRLGLVTRYYALTTLSVALGLWDWLRYGTPAGWGAPEGTR